MLELTICKEGNSIIILGINGTIVEYKKLNGSKIEINPLDPERVVIYSKNWDKEISTTPKTGFYPIIAQPSKNQPYCPGKITEIKKINNKPKS